MLALQRDVFLSCLTVYFYLTIPVSDPHLIWDCGCRLIKQQVLSHDRFGVSRSGARALGTRPASATDNSQRC
jgi:hypothetical protein